LLLSCGLSPALELELKLPSAASIDEEEEEPDEEEEEEDDQLPATPPSVSLITVLLSVPATPSSATTSVGE
jgi:hypothetical protein